MFKHILILLSIIQLVTCLSLRSNIWWSRRSDIPKIDYNTALNKENPSFETKISVFCYIQCQKPFTACILGQMDEVASGSFDFCQIKSNQCQKYCSQDKRIGEMAEANWRKMVKVLRNFDFDPSTEVENKN